MDLKNIRDFLLFSIKAYIKFWFQTSFARLAPNNDILFIKQVLALKSTIPKIVESVSNKLVNHLWYLNNVNVALAFFDENVSNQTKRQMVQRLNQPVLSNLDNNPLRLSIADISELKNLSLPKLTSIRTKTCFRIVGIDTDFLKLDPKHWKNNMQFRNAQEKVNNLTCVNDSAERAIALYQKYKDNVSDDGAKSNLIQKDATNGYSECLSNWTKKMIIKT